MTAFQFLFADHGDPYMPFPANTPTVDDLPGLGLQDIAQLPVELLAILQRDVDERAAAKRDLDASILAAEAAVKTARLDLEYASIRAPISGRISKEEVTVGNLIQGDGPSPTLLTAIENAPALCKAGCGR